LKKQGKSLDDKGPDDGLSPALLPLLCVFVVLERQTEVRAYRYYEPALLPIFRIDNVVSNMSEFAQAFGCKAGQKMGGHACRVLVSEPVFRENEVNQNGQPSGWPSSFSLHAELTVDVVLGLQSLA